MINSPRAPFLVKMASIIYHRKALEMRNAVMRFVSTKIRSFESSFHRKKEGIEIQLKKETSGNFGCKPNFFLLFIFPISSHL